MISKGAAQKAAAKGNKKPKVKYDEFGQSPKLERLFELIDQMKPGEKGVIFSQWTSLLDIVQRSMQDMGHTFTRIDGSMNPQQRLLVVVSPAQSGHPNVLTMHRRRIKQFHDLKCQMPAPDVYVPA